MSVAPIIGKPPEQKRGAVFGDVPIAEHPEDMRALFVNVCGIVLRRVSERDATPLNTTDLCAYLRRDPVTLLAVTPAEPEPDPAVTTYGELEPGAAGVNEEGDMVLVCREDQVVFRLRDGETYEEEPGAPVRRVFPIEAAAHVLGKDAGASVVVHEEPGTLFADWPRKLVVCPGDQTITRADAERLLCQLAALLSTPEPASDGDTGEQVSP